MKKFIYSMLAVLAIAATTTVFTSCGEDEDTIVVISVGIQQMSVLGSSNADDTTIWAFSEEVETAYRKALGMTDSNDLILKNVDYSTTCADMTKKFESATLPSQPSLNCTYKLTYALYGTKDSGNKEILASKTFTNE